MTVLAPPVDELATVLQRELERTEPHLAPIASIARRPSAYRSSFGLDELDVTLADGTVLPMVLKHVGELLPGAVGAKPPFLGGPRRELLIYRAGFLGPGLAPACHGMAAGRGWLFLERLAGPPLTETGDLEAWREAARTLARLHGRFAGRTTWPPALLRRDARFYRHWPRRAIAFLRRRSPDRDAMLRLLRVASRYDAVVERLLGAPQTLLHGEPFASNILLASPGGAPVGRLVDWELAGPGPGALDLAALVAGRWSEPHRAEITAAYVDAGPASLAAGLEPLLDACRLHFAMQWLGWSPSWTPPADHAHDWLGEALDAAERLGI